MKTVDRRRKLQQKARRALWDIYERLGNWRSVERETGIKYGTANAIARGKRPASKMDIEKLFPKQKRYYKNYRRKWLMLRKYIKQLNGSVPVSEDRP